MKDSRLKLPTSALRVRLLLALASIVLALMAMLTTAIPNLRGGGGGAEFVVVVMGLWALPHALYVIIIRTREMSKVAGLALLITTSFWYSTSRHRGHQRLRSGTFLATSFSISSSLQP